MNIDSNLIVAFAIGIAAGNLLTQFCGVVLEGLGIIIQTIWLAYRRDRDA